MSQKLINKILQLVDVTIEDRQEITKLSDDLNLANDKNRDLLNTVKFLEKELEELRNIEPIA